MQRRKIETTVTYLEMPRPPYAGRPGGKSGLPPLSSPEGVSLVHAPQLPLHFYRYLYRAVGREYKWCSREYLDDAGLASIVHHRNTGIYILYKEGAPAGFIEIDWRKSFWRKTGEITLLGLVPEQVGKGLGRYLLRRAIALAWGRPINKLLIETCTCDHPRALQLYQTEGFAPYCRRKETITLPSDWEQRTAEAALAGRLAAVKLPAL